MKKFFTFIFYVSAIAFCVFVFIAQKDLYLNFQSVSFGSSNDIKAFIANIMLVIPSVIVLLSTLLSFLSFLMHIRNPAKKIRKLTKCASKIGWYFVFITLFNYLSNLVLLLGDPTFADEARNGASDPNFYIPLAIAAALSVVLLICRFITRGGPVIGVIIAICMGGFIFLNFYYYRATFYNAESGIRFILCLVTCGLAALPSFMPEPRKVEAETKENSL